MPDGDPILLGEHNEQAAHTTFIETLPGFSVPSLVLAAVNLAQFGGGLQGTSAPGGVGVEGNSVRSSDEPVTGRGPGVFGISDFGSGVEGITSSSSQAGVEGGNKDGAGVFGRSSTGPGVEGRSLTGPGVEGASRDGAAVRGLGSAAPGVQGASSSGPGVEGFSQSSPGVHGMCGDNNPGVLGITEGPDSAGVVGLNGPGDGVLGNANAGNGVSGFSDVGTGVRGESESNIGVFGRSNTGFAGFFRGKVRVTGMLEKSGGGFRIDHPLDPANMYLNHGFVESSEMKNVYDGVVVLDEDGAAWVELPRWFEELNSDYCYQLTAIGAPMHGLHVAEEIYANRFRVAGGEPGAKVCWQVTGVRKDRWAAANPFGVEEEKPPEERGRYLHPQLYGQPEESGIGRIPRRGQQLQRIRQQIGRRPPEPSFDWAHHEERLQGQLRQMEERRRQIEELRRQAEEQEPEA